MFYFVFSPNEIDVIQPSIASCWLIWFSMRCCNTLINQWWRYHRMPAVANEIDFILNSRLTLNFLEHCVFESIATNLRNTKRLLLLSCWVIQMNHPPRIRDHWHYIQTLINWLLQLSWIFVCKCGAHPKSNEIDLFYLRFGALEIAIKNHQTKSSDKWIVIISCLHTDKRIATQTKLNLRNVCCDRGQSARNLIKIK